MSKAAELAALIGGGSLGGIVKEQLVMLCDGNDYTVGSGTYTSTNVTAEQTMSNTFTDITGSSISYTPPSGTTMVIYKYVFSHNFEDSDNITHVRTYIDSDEVTSQRQNIQTYTNLNTEYHHTILIPIGGAADTATGRQATWTSAKTIKIQGRSYSTSHQAKFHTIRNWDGANVDSSDMIRKPQLIITSLK